MKYKEGKLGRVFVLRFEHGDDLLQEMSLFLREEHISAGIIYMIGALEEAGLVVGPRQCVIPPAGIPWNFADGREIMALGTIFPDDEGNPIPHIHSAFGREGSTVTGCLRENARVYLLVEAIIVELEGISARRTFDDEFQIKVLRV